MQGMSRNSELRGFAVNMRVEIVKKIALFIVTSFVALGTSAVGIKSEQNVEVKNVVIIVSYDDSSKAESNAASVVRWR